MKLLEPSDYEPLRGLIADSEHDLAVAAVAARHATGRVWIDDPRAPGLALVSPHWGRLYLCGKASPKAAIALRDLLRQEIWPAGSAAGFFGYTLAHSPGWQVHLPRVMEGRRTVQADRQYYRWEGEVPPAIPPPLGFALLPADADLLARSQLRSLQALREEMTSERASLEDFLAHSFGIAAVHDDELAGWCLSEYNTGDRCEVGIATLEPFQRRGLATAMGSAFLSMACERGLREVGWHCWKENRPSAAAARAIGFEHVADHPVYFGWYDEANAAD